MNMTKNTKNSFLIYYDWFEVFEQLNDDELGKMFRAMCEYQVEKKLPKMSKHLQLLFAIFRQQFDRNNEKWSTLSDIRSRSANKRWDANASKRMQMQRKGKGKGNKEINKEKENTIDLFIKFYNGKFNKKFQANPLLSKNLDYWLKIYSMDQIKMACVLANNADEWWRDKATPMKLLRTNNDHIGDLLNKHQGKYELE